MPEDRSLWCYKQTSLQAEALVTRRRSRPFLKIVIERKEIKGLKGRVGRDCYISRGGPRGTVEVYKLEESKEEVTVLVGVRSLEETGKTFPEMRFAKSFESRKEEV